MNVDIDRLRRAVGHTHEYIDPRIDLPLEGCTPQHPRGIPTAHPTRP